MGRFLKELRKEKGMTQEQLAEYLNVSGRTVSRWETGVNMPDLDILIELADYYGTDIRELLDGERKGEKMDKELKETLLKTADYSNSVKQRLEKRMFMLFTLGLISFVTFLVLDFSGMTADTRLEAVAWTALGLAFGVMVVGLLFTSGILLKIKTTKQRLAGKNK